MKTSTTLLGISLLFGLLAPAMAVQHGNTHTYGAHLMPVNNSNVYAQVEVKLVNDKQLMVSIEASGLEAGKVHPQHIHGFNKPVKNAVCPPAEADVNADGVISVAEGVPFFGPIILPLVPFNLVDENGYLTYNASFSVKAGDFQPLHKRTVVLHGMTVNGEYIPSLPIACGELEIM